MFRSFINFIITFLVFFFGATFFPENIQIANTGTAILATILMFVMSWILVILLIVSIGSIFANAKVGAILTIIMVIIGLFVIPIQLLILSATLSGFAIHGFWTYAALTFILFIFRAKAPKKS